MSEGGARERHEGRRETPGGVGDEKGRASFGCRFQQGESRGRGEKSDMGVRDYVYARGGRRVIEKIPNGGAPVMIEGGTRGEKTAFKGKRRN